jgi:WD40 repeat protein
MATTTVPSGILLDLVTFGDPHLHAQGEIQALSFASDGSLWSVEELGVVRQWSLPTGQPVVSHRLSDLETVWTFSSNARLLASASDDLSIWDPKSGQLLNALAQASWVTALTFHPNKPHVATGHDDGVVRIWDINRSILLREFTHHVGPVSALAFAPNGLQLASAAEDKRIALWDLAGGKHLGDLIGHKDRIPALAWHPAGRLLVSAGWDTTARVWNAQTLEPIILLNSHATQVWTLAFSQDGQRLACADSQPAVHIWRCNDWAEIHVLKEQGAEIRHLAFSADGNRLAGGGAGLIHLWDPHQGKSLSRSAASSPTPVAMSLSPDGSRLAANGSSGLLVWETAGQKPLFALDEEKPVHVLADSPDGRWIAGGTDEYIRLWEAGNGQPRGLCEGPREPITVLAFSPDSQTLASGSALGMTVWLWNTEDGDPKLLIPDPLDGCTVEALAFHPAGRLLAVGGIDQLATAGSTGAVSLWDLVDRCEVATFAGGVTSLVFDRPGRQLATGGVDAVVCVWDVEQHELIVELFGHDAVVRAVAFSPDGRWLVSGGDDLTLRIWETATWTEKAIRELDSPVELLAFSPDGRYLYTGNGNSVCYRLELARLVS